MALHLMVIHLAFTFILFSAILCCFRSTVCVAKQGFLGQIEVKIIFSDRQQMSYKGKQIKEDSKQLHISNLKKQVNRIAVSDLILANTLTFTAAFSP